jgi:hypothetical protein
MMVSARHWARGNHGVDAAPLIVAVGVAADRTDAAQGRGAERRGEAAIRRAAGRLARGLEDEACGRAAVGFEELTALFILFERQKIPLAQNAALAAGQFAAAPDLAHLAENFLHDVQRRKADIDGCGGSRRDSVDCGASLDEPDIDRCAELVIGGCRRWILRLAPRGADPLGVSDAGMRGGPGHLQFDKGGAFARDTGLPLGRQGSELKTARASFASASMTGRDEGEAISSSEV